MQEFPCFQGGVDHGVWVVALLGDMFGRADNQVDGQYEMIGYRPTDRIAALWPIVICLQHDWQIYVVALAGFAAGMAAEEDDQFKVEAFGDQLGYCSDRGFVDLGFDDTPTILNKALFLAVLRCSCLQLLVVSTPLVEPFGNR